MQRDENRTTRPDPSGKRELAIHAMVVERNDAPDKCILYPATRSSDAPVMTAWMTAVGEGFVDLRTMR